MITDVTNTNRKMAYSVNEVSELTTLSKSFLRNEIRAGNLKVRKISRRILILNEDLTAYLNKEAVTNGEK